jgi:hypothetical protein
VQQIGRSPTPAGVRALPPNQRSKSSFLNRIAGRFSVMGKKARQMDGASSGKATSDNLFGAVDAPIDESLDRAKRTAKEHP